jgi:phosphatidylglycerophosphatase A
MSEVRPNICNPAVFIATMGGIGWLPKAPGTFGALVTLPIAWVITTLIGPVGLVIFCILIFFAGMWSTNYYSRITKTEDSSHCVIDECLGQCIVLLPITTDPILYIIGFVCFRFFDILKPWPTNWCDRTIKGGFGIMLDDVMAAIQAIIVMFLLTKVINVF